jgi:hypothetical protein
MAFPSLIETAVTSHVAIKTILVIRAQLRKAVTVNAAQ